LIGLVIEDQGGDDTTGRIERMLRELEVRHGIATGLPAGINLAPAG
jgi:hypothetical protein